MCGHHHTVPRLYKLEGVIKEGDHPQRISKAVEIWKGRYNDKVVALKVLSVPRDDPHVQRTKGVSTLHITRGGQLVAILTDEVAILRGSGVDEAARAQKHPPFLWDLDDRCRLLPSVSLVRKRKYHGLPEEAAKYR